MNKTTRNDLMKISEDSISHVKAIMEKVEQQVKTLSLNPADAQTAISDIRNEICNALRDSLVNDTRAVIVSHLEGAIVDLRRIGEDVGVEDDLVEYRVKTIETLIGMVNRLSPECIGIVIEYITVQLNHCTQGDTLSRVYQIVVKELERLTNEAFLIHENEYLELRNYSEEFDVRRTRRRRID